MTWKTMEAWKKNGPPNGERMLVLTDEGHRFVAWFDGMSQSWYSEPAGASIKSYGEPIAWTDIPLVPACISRRHQELEALHQQVEELGKKPFSQLELNEK